MAVYLFAGIDVGSYNLEMTIFQISDKGVIKPVDRIKQSVLTGNDTYRKGRISYEHIDEMCRVLTSFKKIMDDYHITDYKAYGTSALREAINRDIVLDQIKVRTGLEVVVLGNAQQRFLCYKAIALKDPAFEQQIKTGTVIADVGSGSTQFSIFDKDNLISSQYLKLGTMRIYDVLDRVGSPIEKARNLVEELIDADIQTFKNLYLKDRKIETIVLAGYSASLLGQHFKGKQKNCVSVEEFQEFYKSAVKCSPFELSRKLDISIDDAKLLLPGIMIYKKIIDVAGAKLISLPGITLSDGIAAEYTMDNKLRRFQHDFNKDILSSARSIAKRYKSNQKHAQSLEELALAIFDGTRKIHGLGKREKLLLQLAAILHDCGKFVSITDPASSAYYIIVTTEIIGLSTTEQKMVANIVKYYPLEFDYEVLGDEGVEKRNTVAKLVAILKLAGVLDRSHMQKVHSVRCTIKDNELILSTDADGDLTLEEIYMKSRADFFEEVYGIRPVLRRKRVTKI